MIRRMFEPAAVPERFDRLFPKELMVRPSNFAQLQRTRRL